MNNLDLIYKLDQAHSLISEVQTALRGSTTLVKPARDSALMLSNEDSSDVLLSPWSSPIQENGKFTFYYRGWNLMLRCISDTGLPGSMLSAHVTRPNIQYGAVAKITGGYINSWHEWLAGHITKCHFAKSTDGIIFTEYLPSQEILSGEDRSILEVNGLIYCFIRTQPIPREISVMTSSDGITWSSMNKIIPFNQTDFDNPSHADYRKHYYCMVVCKNGNDWWGILNTLRLGNNGEETLSNPTGDELTTNVELAYSPDGLTWTRCNGSKPFITRPDGILQQYGAPTIVGNEMWIYVDECKSVHGIFDHRLRIVRYTISLEDLNKYRP